MQRNTDLNHINILLLELMPISNLRREQLQFNWLQFFWPKTEVKFEWKHDNSSRFHRQIRSSTSIIKFCGLWEILSMFLGLYLLFLGIKSTPVQVNGQWSIWILKMTEEAELCPPRKRQDCITEGDRISVLATQTFTNPLNQMVKHFQTRLLFSTFEVSPWNACEVWLTAAGSASPRRICCRISSSSCTDSIKIVWIWYSPKHPTPSNRNLYSTRMRPTSVLLHWQLTVTR